MHLLVVEHEPDTTAAMLAEHAVALGHTLHVHDVSAGPPPSVEGHDAVLVMGASASVTDPDIAPWLTRELDLLRDAARRGVPVLGVCFGAQVLAAALGGSVTRAPRIEVGWTTVDTTDPDLIPPGPWFQWHEDAVTPPRGATLLATTEVCIQAYTVGPHLGVQFHPEVTDAEVGAWVRSDPDTPRSLGLDPEKLVAETRALLPAARARAAGLLDRFLTGAAAR